MSFLFSPTESADCLVYNLKFEEISEGTMTYRRYCQEPKTNLKKSSANLVV